MFPWVNADVKTDAKIDTTSKAILGFNVATFLCSNLYTMQSRSRLISGGKNGQSESLEFGFGTGSVAQVKAEDDLPFGGIDKHSTDLILARECDYIVSKLCYYFLIFKKLLNLTNFD